LGGGGSELGHVEEGVAEQVGRRHGRLAGAHVDRDHAAAAGLDVQVHGLAAPPALALGALEDEPGLEELVDEPADHAPPHPHEASQLRPGDRLLRPDQVERDLPVDLARGPAPGDAERGGVDPAHGLYRRFRTREAAAFAASAESAVGASRAGPVASSTAAESVIRSASWRLDYGPNWGETASLRPPHVQNSEVGYSRLDRRDVCLSRCHS
jgi:hypothetical protein